MAVVQKQGNRLTQTHTDTDTDTHLARLRKVHGQIHTQMWQICVDKKNWISYTPKKETYWREADDAKFAARKKEKERKNVLGMSWRWIHMNESCLTCEWVISHICMSHVTHANESCYTYEWVMSHIWMSHVTHMNDSCHTCEWVMAHVWMSHVTHMNESCHTCGWVMSHIWTSHVTHMNEPSHIWMKHVTHMHESCHTYG